MSIALVVTRGYSNGTLTGFIADVTLRGYTIGEVPEQEYPDTPNLYSRQAISDNAYTRQKFGGDLYSRTGFGSNLYTRKKLL